MRALANEVGAGNMRQRRGGTLRSRLNYASIGGPAHERRGIAFVRRAGHKNGRCMGGGELFDSARRWTILSIASASFATGVGTNTLAQTIGAPIRLSASDSRINRSTVNSHLMGHYQPRRNVAGLTGRGYAVTWLQHDVNAPVGAVGSRVHARRFMSDGRPRDATDIVLSESSGAFHYSPAIAALFHDTMVIAWWQDFPTNSVYIRRIDENGQPIEITAVLASTIEDGVKDDVTVTRLAGGGFVVVWSTYAEVAGSPECGRLMMRRYGIVGSPLDAVEQQVNATTGCGRHYQPSVAPRPDGSFVVSWRGAPTSIQGKIFTRRFAADGSALDAIDTRVSPAGQGEERFPSIAALSSGGYVVTWRNDQTQAVYLRRFDLNGSALDGNPVLVSLRAQEPVIAALPDDAVFVAWRYRPPGLQPREIQARRYSSTGLPLDADPFAVNLVADSVEGPPALATLNGGADAAIIWSSLMPIGRVGVYGARFRVSTLPIARADTATAATGLATVLDVLANDADADPGDALRIVGAVASGGTVEVVNRRTRLRYTPPASGGTSATIIYTIKDRAGHRAKARVQISITP